jgi:tetratricopeptide (TPR) repeat protein
MKNNRFFIFSTGLILVLAMFVGCGGRSGENEYNKAVKAWRKGDLVQARTLFEKSTGRLSGNDKKSVAYNQLGLVLWDLNEPQAAADAFDVACSLSEGVTDARLNLAMAWFCTGDYDGAARSLNMYLGESPENKTALVLKGLIAAKKRDWAQSVRLVAQAAAGDPNDPAVQNALAVAELNHGQSSDQVINRLRKITATHPDYAPALYNLGVVYDQWRHEKTAALQYYQAYLSKAGGEAGHADAVRQAMAQLNGQASSVDSAAAVQYMKEGARLHGAGKHAQAVDQFRKAIKADAGQKNAYYNMALAYYALENYSNAAQACQSALNIDARFADARYMLALSYVMQKNWTYAEREARKLSGVDAKRGRELLDYIATARQ